VSLRQTWERWKPIWPIGQPLPDEPYIERVKPAEPTWKFWLTMLVLGAFVLSLLFWMGPPT
jgi:hypothetical protein